jgi:hypothetical protein
MEQQILGDLEVSATKPTNTISRENELAKIVAEVEKEAAQTALKLPARRHFNQPNLLSVSSLNAVDQAPNASPYSLTGFNSFNVNLPLPLLDVESLQLLNANIPQASQNISDTACVFWYYRLSSYSGVIPNPNNLFFVRLLPSYYKQEFIENATNYGINRTFKKYSDLATELVKSCSNDLAFNNLEYIVANDPANAPNIKVPFLKDAVSLTYNSTLNKFQFTGIPTTPVFVNWFDIPIYAINDIIAYEGLAYKSKQNANQNNIPSTAGVVNTAWWERLYSTEVIADWSRTTPYGPGRYVSYNDTLWQSVTSTIGFPPDGGLQAWLSINLYYVGSVVSYSGNFYTCVVTSLNNVPGLTGNWIPLLWSSIQFYPQGVVIQYDGSYYVSKQNNTNQTPDPSGTDYWTFVGNSFWTAATLPDPDIDAAAYNYLSTGYNDPNVQLLQGSGQQQWSPYHLYEAEPSSIVKYNGRNWTNAFQQTINEAPFNVDDAVITSAVGENGIATYQAENFFVAGQVIEIDNLTPSTFNGVYRIANCNSGSFSVVNTAFISLETSTGVGDAAYPTYDGAYQYRTGDVVLWDITLPISNYYIATADTSGQNPSPLFRNWRLQTWEIANDTAPTVGLNVSSQLVDFIEVITIAGLDILLQEFPYTIPGQPFTSPPKRLLNTVLGFTFNGTFNPSVYTNLNTVEFIDNITDRSNAPYYNLLRPVPSYVSENEPLASPTLLGSTPTQALTYTADGYCNLVFSSVIYIYSTIVLGSSVDTQRTSNLLAVMPLACGNLGITFASNFIDNPMTKVHGDLYTVGIELFNEYAEPYYLTNNAVATFLFKLTYKSAEKVVQNIL